MRRAQSGRASVQGAGRTEDAVQRVGDVRIEDGGVGVHVLALFEARGVDLAGAVAADDCLDDQLQHACERPIKRCAPSQHWKKAAGQGRDAERRILDR